MTTSRFLLLPSVLLAPLPFFLLACSGSVAQTITADWSSPGQTIDGFGAASASTERTLTPSQMDFFYTPQGIGLNIIRIRIQPDLKDCEANEKKGNCISQGLAAITNYDLANAQAALARGAIVIAAEWSPPGSMKSNGSFMTGGAFIGNAANYANLARIEASFVTLVTGRYGIPIYAISPQNEPDVSQTYASSAWTPQQIHDFVPYLSAALSSAGYSKTKIMIADSGKWEDKYATTAMNDPTVAAEIGILASHGYGSSASVLNYNNMTTQPQWQTEISDSNPYDGSIASGLAYATQIHHWLTTARVGAWLYWELTAQGGDTDNEALTDINGKIPKRAYAIGNWSRFVRPGWKAVSVSNPTPLLVTAFKNPLGTTGAVVAVNTTRKPITANFAVGSVMGTNVTPWLTSSSASLAAQTTIPVSSGSFSATVPAESIATFTNTDSPSPGPQDPLPRVQ